MANKRVEIEVNGKVMVSADVSRAQQELNKLTAGPGTIGAAPTPHAPPATPPSTIGSGPSNPHPTPPTPAPHNEGQRNWMENTAWRMMQNASVSLSTTRTEADFRRLGDRIERATGYAQGAGNEELIRQLKALKDAMEEHRKATLGQAGGAGSPPPPTPPPGSPLPPGGPGQGTPGWMRNAGQWLQNQGGNSAMGGLGRWIGGPTANALMGGSVARLLTGPIGMGLGAVTALNYAFNATANNIKEENAPARNEMLGMADLARQYGSDRNLFFNFRNQYGQTNTRFRELGYTATQAAHTAALLDRPGGMMNDTTSVLQYARSMGVDESKVASIARTFGVAGVGGLKGGNADDGLRVMKLAVSEGIKAGIAGSDTMNSLVGFASRNYQEGRATSATGLASFSQLLARMNNTGSAVLRGEQGASAVQGVLNGIGNADPGLEYLMLNSIGAPSAKAVGLSGKEADAYERLRKTSPLEAGRYLLNRVQSGENPGLRDQITKGIDEAAGGNPALQMRMYQQAFGLSPQQALGMIANGGISNLFRSNPADLEKRKQGDNLKDDVQGGNRVAGQTLEYRTAEQDREMMKSLGYLKNLEGIEGTINNIYTTMSDVRAILADGFSGGNNFGADGSMQGRAGQWFTPSTLTGGPGTTAEPRASGNTPSPQASQRTLAAVAQIESLNGTHKSMNAPKPGGAVGLFQMQSKWLPPQANGHQGWAAEAGVSMKNPDGSAVRTEAQARAWQLANPVQANQIAVSRLTRLEQQIRDRAKKDGVTLTNAQVAGYVGLVWHSNGGANLNPILRGGKMIGNPMLLSNDAHGDGISDRTQFDRVSGAYDLPSLKAPATGIPAQSGGGVPPGITNPNVAGGKLISGMAAAQGGKFTFTQGMGANKAYVDPTTKKLVDRFGYGAAGHTGWDFTLGKQGIDGKDGAPISAPANGTLFMKSNVDRKGNFVGLGRQVTLVGASGAKMIFGHLNKFPNVKDGQRVTAGQTIGYEGSTGNSTGAHVHFEVRDARNVIMNPNNLKVTPAREFARGGYTGDGPRHAEAGIVHGQEFVVSAAQTARYRPLLERMNAGALPGGAQAVTVNVGGTVTVAATLSGPARAQIEERTQAYRQDVGRIVASDLGSHRGAR